MPNLRFWRRHEVRVGDLWDPERDGPTCWRDGNAPDDPPAGYYPINPDGTLNSEVRLRWVDDAPHDSNDGRGHLEIMEPDGPYSHRAATVPGSMVQLEARVLGEGGVNS